MDQRSPSTFLGTDLGGLEELILLAKKHKVKSFKFIDIEMVFEPSAPEYVALDPRVFGDPIKTPASEDEALFWSSGGAQIQDSSGDIVPPPLVGEDVGS